MKNLILIFIGIVVALIVVGGAVAYTFVSDVADDAGSIDSSSVDNIIDKVEDKVASQSGSSSQSSGSDDSSSDNDDNGIVSEEVKFNAQEGDGYYREVTYKDGGFRQYDTESGELIGSSYDSDQDQLPSLE